MFRKTINSYQRSNKNRKNGRSFYFTQEVTEEMLMNYKNYDGVFHRHVCDIGDTTAMMLRNGLQFSQSMYFRLMPK